MVNLLTVDYGVSVKRSPACSAKEKEKFVFACARACGFFPNLGKQVHAKAHVDAHIKSWLPELLRPTFIPCMATPHIMLGRPNHPHECTVLKANYALAKSVLENNRLTPHGSARMKQIVEMLVQLKSKWGV